MRSTRDMFQAYLQQLEQSGIRQLYWTLPKPGQLKRRKTRDRDRIGALAQVEQRVRECTLCPLHEGRTQTVFGAGDPEADLVFVGEAPGLQEDRQGIPFVGEAGHLLTKIIEAMHLSRDNVFICNVIKCRPPGNRNPNPDEVISCQPYLVRQLEIIQPQVICAMGKFAAQTLLDSTAPISRLRGQWFEYQGIPLMPTFHPAYLLRNPNGKRQVWEDMQQIMARLGLSV